MKQDFLALRHEGGNSAEEENTRRELFGLYGQLVVLLSSVAPQVEDGSASVDVTIISAINSNFIKLFDDICPFSPSSQTVANHAKLDTTSHLNIGISAFVSLGFGCSFLPLLECAAGQTVESSII